MIKESLEEPAHDWNSDVPEEVKMMQRMKKTGCQSVPELIDYKRYIHVRKHRIYMEFCPYKDLFELNLNYCKFRLVHPPSRLLDTWLTNEGPTFQSHSFGTRSTILCKQLRQWNEGQKIPTVVVGSME